MLVEGEDERLDMAVNDAGDEEVICWRLVGEPLGSAYNLLRILLRHAKQVQVGHGGEPLIDDLESESNAGNASFYPTLYRPLCLPDKAS